MEVVGFFVSVWLQFLFLLSPFVVLSAFLSLTTGMDAADQQRVALRSTMAAVGACLVLFVAGDRVFRLLGITMDSFRVGAGSLLFLSAIAIVQGRPWTPRVPEGTDPSVVPLAIPVIVGPAVAGTVLVMAAECTKWWQKIIGFGALVWAALCVGAILYMGPTILRRVGRELLSVLVKLSGLILAALASQIIFTGIRNLLR